MEWISVKDRLPKPGVDVLVRYRYTDTAPPGPWNIDFSFHEPDDKENNGWNFGSCCHAEVSHWIPKSHLLRLPK